MSDGQVLASIKLNPYNDERGCYSCGCQQRGTRWHLCSYHEGYGDGCDAGEERLRAALSALCDASDDTKQVQSRSAFLSARAVALDALHVADEMEGKC